MTALRFRTVDIYVDSKQQSVAAYQLEWTTPGGDAKIVGIEGGENPAFKEPPYYDPKAIQHERVILAAFSTANVEALPIVSHPAGELMVDGEYFQTKRHTLRGDSIHLNSAGQFQALTCIEGVINILHPMENVMLIKGQTALIAASLGDYTLSGEGVVLRSYMV